MRIFIVTGCTGKYDSYVKWNVAACTNFSGALKFKEKLNDYLKSLEIPLVNSIECDKFEYDSQEIINCPDHHLLEHWDQYGVKYEIEEVQAIE